MRLSPPGTEYPRPDIVWQPWQMSIEQHGAAIADQVRLEVRDGASQNPSPHCRPSLLLLEVNFNRASWQQPMVRFDEDAGRRHVDNRRIDTWPHQSRHDAVLLDRLARRRISRRSKPGVTAGAIGATANRSERSALWPCLQQSDWCTACCHGLLEYNVPDEDVPSALKLTILLAPNRIGSSPGAGLPASIAGSPGNVPNSTPLNWLDNCSGAEKLTIDVVLNVASEDAVAVSVDIDRIDVTGVCRGEPQGHLR